MSTAFPNEPTGATVLLDWPFNTVAGSGLIDSYNSGRLVSDSSAPISPPNCLLNRLEPFQTNGGGAQLDYYLSSPADSAFIGLSWKPNAEYGGAPSGFNKLFLVSNQESGSAFEFYGQPGQPKQLAWIPQNGGVLSNGHVAGTFGDDPGTRVFLSNVGNGYVTFGVWNKIEFYWKKSTTNSSRDGIARWWLNGALVGNYTNVNCGQSPFYWFSLNHTWDGYSGNVNPDHPTAWEHRFDHLYISVGGTGSGGSGGGGGGGGGGTPEILPAPTGLYPNGVTLPYGETTFQWNAVPGASQYAVRIHKVGEPYEPTSSLLAYTTQAGNSIVRTTAPNSQYDWWVHSVNSIGELGPSNGALLTTSASPVPPPPNPDPPPDPPPPPPVDPPVDPPPPVVIPPVDPTDPATLPPETLPTPQVLGTATVIVTIKDRQNPIKKEFHFYG